MSVDFDPDSQSGMIHAMVVDGTVGEEFLYQCKNSYANDNKIVISHDPNEFKEEKPIEINGYFVDISESKPIIDAIIITFDLIN